MSLTYTTFGALATSLVVVLGCDDILAGKLRSGAGGAGGDHGAAGRTAASGDAGAAPVFPSGGGAGEIGGAGRAPSSGGATHSDAGGAAGEIHAQAAGGAEAGSSSTGVSGAAGAAVICDFGLAFCAGQCIDLKRGILSEDTVIHCGTCDGICDARHTTSVACVDGECVPTCSPGFEDCNGPAHNDGCEADLESASHCGACGRACSKTGAARMSCVEGACMPACLPGFADCQPDDGTGADDGCEVYIDALKRCGTTCEDGVACEPSEVCNVGVCGPPQGLVKLSVPFTEADQKQRYGDKFGPVDLTNGTVLIRAYAPGATGGQVHIHVFDGDWTSGAAVDVPLSTLSDGWTDVELPVGSVDGDFDPSQTQSVTLEIESGSSGPWTNPTVVYIDSIRSSNQHVDDSFDVNIGGITVSQMQIVFGSTMSWLDALPESGQGGAGG